MLADAVPEALAKGVQQILEEVSYNKEKKGPDADKAVQMRGAGQPATVDAELAPCDLVIEAIVENPEVKKQLYARLEPQLSPTGDPGLEHVDDSDHASWPKGSSSPSGSAASTSSTRCGKMPLVEVIRGAKTSDETIATAVAYAKSIGKSPIVVNDGPGFLVNRLLLPYMNEALELICRRRRDQGHRAGGQGVRHADGADHAVRRGRARHRVLRRPRDGRGVSRSRRGLADSAGAGQGRPPGPKDRARASSRYKDKTGRGDARPGGRRVDQAVRPQARRSSRRSRSPHRLFLPMLLEATRVLEDKVVRDVRDVDLGLIFGIGFPPFKGGLFFWADTLGAAKIVEMLKPLESLGTRMKPTPMLLEMAKTGGKFYDTERHCTESAR